MLTVTARLLATCDTPGCGAEAGVSIPVGAGADVDKSLGTALDMLREAGWHVAPPPENNTHCPDHPKE